MTTEGDPAVTTAAIAAGILVESQFQIAAKAGITRARDKGAHHLQRRPSASPSRMPRSAAPAATTAAPQPAQSCAGPGRSVFVIKAPTTCSAGHQRPRPDALVAPPQPPSCTPAGPRSRPGWAGGPQTAAVFPGMPPGYSSRVPEQPHHRRDRQDGGDENIAVTVAIAAGSPSSTAPSTGDRRDDKAGDSRCQGRKDGGRGGYRRPIAPNRDSDPSCWKGPIEVCYPIRVSIAAPTCWRMLVNSLRLAGRR